MTITTTGRTDTGRPPSTPRHTRRPEMTERPTGRAAVQGGRPKAPVDPADRPGRQPDGVRHPGLLTRDAHLVVRRRSEPVEQLGLA